MRRSPWVRRTVVGTSPRHLQASSRARLLGEKLDARSQLGLFCSFEELEAGSARSPATMEEVGNAPVELVSHARKNGQDSRALSHTVMR